MLDLRLGFDYFGAFFFFIIFLDLSAEGGAWAKETLMSICIPQPNVI
jgi:hypothetical protein